jgi:hypothetical protein
MKVLARDGDRYLVDLDGERGVIATATEVLSPHPQSLLALSARGYWTDADQDAEVLRLVEPLAKHATHDQSTHGNWADGWSDPGGNRPEFGAPREQRDAWDSAIRAGVALGRIPPQEAKDRGMYDVRPEVVKPLPAELYHATTAASSVMREGLKTRDEVKGTGLGGGTSDTISFTTDPALAQRIADVMLEARAVLRGELPVEDLVAESKRVGFYDLFMRLQGSEEAFTEQVLGHRQVVFESMSTRDEVAARRGEGDWEPAGPTFVGGDGKTRASKWMRTGDEGYIQEHDFDAYRSFLAAQENFYGITDVTHYDPLFFLPDLEYLRNLDPAEVAVVRARPVEGAMGTQESAMGEWRTWTGRAVEVEMVKHLLGQHDQSTHGRRGPTAPGVVDHTPDTTTRAWKRVTKDIRKQGPGNCSDAAVTLLMNAEELGLRNARVVQATVMGRGKLEGVRFGHSWLEADAQTLETPQGPVAFRNAYDWSSGNSVVMPDALYRHLGQVQDEHEYTDEEAIREMVKLGHYGPWVAAPMVGVRDWKNSGPVAD